MSKHEFSPSVNIIRDLDKSLNYIVTPNSTQIAKSIANHFESTGHCFNIIGSYGTGKSSFIWALEQSLNKKSSYFYSNDLVFNESKQFEFINIIGSYSSIIENLAKQFNVKDVTPKNVLNGLDAYSRKCKKEGKFLFIIIDEYGKFLEYASQHKSEESIYFLQELAEYINDDQKDIILITSLHQNFAQYGVGLSTQEKNEWNKVSGRFIDLTFNEPVEQLLFLAGERIKQWGFEKKYLDRIENTNQSILDAKIVKNASNFDTDFGATLFPMDIASANCLSRALQNYGQNERSLFTFLNRNGINSLYQYAEHDKWYHLGKVHDFLIQNFYGFIVSSTNPDKNGWDAIRIALEKVESTFNGNYKIAELIVKAIGLLNIFSPEGSKINQDLITNYFSNHSKKEIESTLQSLEKKQIIRFRDYSSRYILFEGTDLDFEKALLDAEQKVNPVTNISQSLKRFYQLPYLFAKSISYKVGTPRFFEYLISDIPIDQAAKGELDGYVNLVFSETMSSKEMQEQSHTDNAIIYAFFERTKSIKQILFDIDKIEFVKKENQDDKIAERELNSLKESLKNQLTNEIITSLTSKSKHVKWYRNGKKIKIQSKRELNRELSEICKDVYHQTPVLKNELINKHKVSVAIATARRHYIRALIKSSQEPYLGFPADKYPAEKTIYLSLLNKSQIHQHIADNRWDFIAPEEGNAFYGLWQKCIEIMNRGKSEKISIKTFYDELSVAPFKLKEGFLGFWVPTFLHIQQDNFALFNDKGYLPFLTEEVFELIHKSPKNFSIKTFSVDGIKLNLLNTYRSLINKKEEGTGNRSVYIETIRPLFIFHRDLPAYTKQSKNLSTEAINFRNAISKASDPETAFFEDIPKALGYSGLDLKNENIDLEDYTKQLKDAIRELRECEQDLINQLEDNIRKIIGAKNKKYQEYKGILEKRFDGIDIQIISPKYKRLLSRIIMPCGQKTDWIKGLFNSLLSKNFEQIRDEEISIFLNKFKNSFKELERLVNLHKLNESRPNENIFAIDIIDKEGQLKQEHIIFPENLSDQYIKLDNEISQLVGKLKPEEQKAMLVKKLQELI